MAYMSQENKKEKAPKLRAIFKKYGLKASIAVRHHSTLVVNIRTSPIDFIGNFNDLASTKAGHRLEKSDHQNVNVYWVGDHYTGKALDCLQEILDVMNDGNFNKSDLMSDYHHVGWYSDINIGQWNKPYVIVGKKATVPAEDTRITKQDLVDLNAGFVNPPKIVKVVRDEWADFLTAGGTF